MTQFNEEPATIKIEQRGDITDLWLRQEWNEVESEEGILYVADEAYMEIPTDELPAAEEILEDFEEWFDYAAEWEPEKPLSRSAIPCR